MRFTSRARLQVAVVGAIKSMVAALVITVLESFMVRWAGLQMSFSGLVIFWLVVAVLLFLFSVVPNLPGGE